MSAIVESCVSALGLSVIAYSSTGFLTSSSPSKCKTRCGYPAGLCACSCMMLLCSQARVLQQLSPSYVGDSTLLEKALLTTLSDAEHIIRLIECWHDNMARLHGLSRYFVLAPVQFACVVVVG